MKTMALEGKPVSQWTKSLGDYFASVRDSDIKKASQVAEREAILRLQRDGQITEQEGYDALHKSTDLAVALRGLQTLVATRQAQAQQQQAPHSQQQQQPPHGQLDAATFQKQYHDTYNRWPTRQEQRDAGVHLTDVDR